MSTALKPRGECFAWPEQCFILTNEVIGAMRWDDVVATAQAMREAGVWRPPFERFAVIAKGKHFLNATRSPESEGEDWWESSGLTREEAQGQLDNFDLKVHFLFPPGDTGFTVRVWVDTHCGRGFVEATEILKERPGFGETTTCMYQMLNVLLATRNVEKSVREDKLVKLGIGKAKRAQGRRYRYTTTISLGRVVEDHEGHAARPGVAKRPHLRRGHTRRQRYGGGLAFEKLIFIEPVFVNADAEWVESLARDHYNIAAPPRKGESPHA